ncbi:MAG: hypothetical protein M1817_006030 [Caeruleum heppii]|nr:MAG: hypothetical protein M1817_006030 [Caeruleum heppii]
MQGHLFIQPASLRELRAPNSQSQVALYPIYGINQGFYDPAIPKAYFESPPVQLDRSEPGSDALRFHYLTLIRNGTLAHQRLRQAEREKGAAENARDAQKRQVQDLNQQNIGLQAKVDELEAKAKKLRAWQEREPAIVHYLGIVNALAEYNHLFGIPDKVLT